MAIPKWTTLPDSRTLRTTQSRGTRRRMRDAPAHRDSRGHRARGGAGSQAWRGDAAASHQPTVMIHPWAGCCAKLRDHTDTRLDRLQIAGSTSRDGICVVGRAKSVGRMLDYPFQLKVDQKGSSVSLQSMWGLAIGSEAGETSTLGRAAKYPDHSARMAIVICKTHR